MWTIDGLFCDIGHRGPHPKLNQAAEGLEGEPWPGAGRVGCGGQETVRTDDPDELSNAEENPEDGCERGVLDCFVDL